MGFTALVLAVALQAAAAPGDRDAVHLKDGSIHRGRIVSETKNTILLEIFGTGDKGETVGTFTFPIRRKDVLRVERASQAARKRAEERARAFETETERRLAALAKLTPRPAEVAGRKGWRLDGTHFELHATCGEAMVREAALALERIFHAYLRFFDIRRGSGTRVKVLFFADFDEYVAHQKAQRQRVLSATAYFDPARNVIVTFDHSRQLEKQLEGRPGGEKAIRRSHGRVRAGMFEALYHEGFHAFASNHLWRGDTRWEFPRWLHEGMATYFEMSVVEGGRLVHGGAPAWAVELLGKALRADTLVPVRDLVTATPDVFVMKLGADHVGSHLHYAQSWALVHMLLRRMDRETLSAYTSAVMTGRDPVAAFERLAGKPVSKVEEELREYVRRLR